MDEPGITIQVNRDGVNIDQHRPMVTSLLTGMALGEALARIPTLLPICGIAQEIAAKRAVAAARGEDAPSDLQDQDKMYGEQARAAAWRLAIDWPRLLDEPAELDALKLVQGTTDKTALASVLLAFLPGLEDVSTGEELAAWIASSTSLAARVVRKARHIELSLPAQNGLQPCGGAELVAIARAAFAVTGFDSLAPSGAGIEVGPSAMRRHPLIPLISDSGSYQSLSRRLLAQALDTIAIAEMLRGEYPVEEANSWTEEAGLGTGLAMTSRGPVFHQVRVDTHRPDRISAWRVLAPTDWHFAVGGPLSRAASGPAWDQSKLAWLVAGLDPCVPWNITDAETAHA